LTDSAVSLSTMNVSTGPSTKAFISTCAWPPPPPPRRLPPLPLRAGGSGPARVSSRPVDGTNGSAPPELSFVSRRQLRPPCPPRCRPLCHVHPHVASTCSPNEQWPATSSHPRSSSSLPLPATTGSSDHQLDHRADDGDRVWFAQRERMEEGAPSVQPCLSAVAPLRAPLRASSATNHG
jgi:hypothetical protein